MSENELTQQELEQRAAQAEAEARSARAKLRKMQREERQRDAEEKRQRAAEALRESRQDPERDRLSELFKERRAEFTETKKQLDAARAAHLTATLAGEDAATLRDLWERIRELLSECERLRVETMALDGAFSNVARVSRRFNVQEVK